MQPDDGVVVTHRPWNPPAGTPMPEGEAWEARDSGLCACGSTEVEARANLASLKAARSARIEARYTPEYRAEMIVSVWVDSSAYYGNPVAANDEALTNLRVMIRDAIASAKRHMP